MPKSFDAANPPFDRLNEREIEELREAIDIGYYRPGEDLIAAGQPVDVTYVFDSYRLSYVYRFHSSGPVSFRAGLTAKLRDAKIELAQGSLSSAKTNTGFVPLLYGGVRWQVTDALALDLDADAAAASQGRAEDVSLRLEARVSPAVDLFIGARTLEGGADNDEVYSFAWFAYAVGGVAIRF